MNCANPNCDRDVDVGVVRVQRAFATDAGAGVYCSEGCRRSHGDAGRGADLTPLEQRIIEELDAAAAAITAARLFREVGLDGEAIREALESLEREGLVQRTAYGRVERWSRAAKVDERA